MGQAFALHVDGYLLLVTLVNGAHVDGRAVDRDSDGSGNVFSGAIPALALQVAPDVFCQFGVVDERVAVALNLIDGLVALDLLLADRVQTGPFHQHVDGPGREGLIAVGGIVQLGTAGPGGQFILVASGHIEIGACQVTLVFVVGLEHGAAVAGIGACAQFAFGYIDAIG